MTKKIWTTEDWVDLILWIIISLFLVGCLIGCVSEKREIVLDSDTCYERGERAVLLCDRRGRCLIQCRPRRLGEQR